MADISVQEGYTSVAPAVRTAISHPDDTHSDQLFTFLALTGAVAGVATSTTLHIGDPAITGLFCTILGSTLATLGWYLGHSIRQTVHPRHHD